MTRAESRHRTKRTDHGGFHMRRRGIKRAFVAQVFALGKEIVFYETVFQIPEGKVCGAGHAQRVK